MKSNDSILPSKDRLHVRTQADRLLREASAYGRFPTPIKDILAATKLQVRPMEDLVPPDHENPEKIKRALSKLQGFLDRRDRTIYLCKSLHPQRRKSLSLHEIAHDYLPDQRLLFEILEESEHELNDGTRDLFERSANCFASDVHFQLDSFTGDARDISFGIVEPVKQLTKRYGAGNYSTLRRYIDVCGKPAALLVCDSDPTNRLKLTVRRFVFSTGFKEKVGNLKWPEVFEPDSWFVLNRPRNVFALPTPHILQNTKHTKVPCFIEGFDSTRQVFFLIYPIEDRFAPGWRSNRSAAA